MAVGDIYQGCVDFILQNNPNEYSWYFRVNSEVDAEAIDDDLTNILAGYITLLLPLQSTAVKFQCTVVRQIAPNKSLPFAAKLIDEGERGTVDADALPGQCSLIVSLFGDTQDPNRFNRGRDYFTGFIEGDQSNGDWDIVLLMQPLLAMYCTIGNTVIGGSGNTYEIGIWSRGRKDHPVLPDVAPAFYQLQRVVLHQFVRTQRRRQPQGPCESVLRSNIPCPPPV